MTEAQSMTEMSSGSSPAGDMDNVETDPAYLYAYNRDPLTSLDASYLKQRAEQDLSFLFNKLKAIAAEQSKTAFNIVLPKPKVVLPRQKPVPAQKKPKTRWEEYAQKKGILPTKRERMIWDDTTQTWKPRWGYKRGKDEQDSWLVELKSNEDPTQDKYQKLRGEKKLRVLKNRQKQLKNQERNAAEQSGSKTTAQDLPSGIANDVSKTGGKRGKKRTKEALGVAQVSTASLGRFDNYQPNEPERKLKTSKRRKFEASEKTSTKARDLKLLERVLKKNK